MKPPSDARIHYLFPVESRRRDSFESVMAGESVPERFLFYGMDMLLRSGISATHNLSDTRMRFIWGLSGRILRKTLVSLGGYSGDLEWLLPGFLNLKRSTLTVAVTDRVAFALLNLRASGLLRSLPVLYIAMGLPEKLSSIPSPKLQKTYLRELGRFDKIIALSKPESDSLILDSGLSNVLFMPAGVDVQYFSPSTGHARMVDILSIGADPFRDFYILLRAARRLSTLSFRLIMSQAHRERLKSEQIPPNAEILVDEPMSRMRDYLRESRIVALPVFHNSYSGATTVLLQAMAVGKAVISNPVASNQYGYHLQDGCNCVFVPTGDEHALVRALDRLSANRFEADRIGINARETVVSKMTIEMFHAELCKVMDEVHVRRYGLGMFH